jgi:hypothetical protein
VKRFVALAAVGLLACPSTAPKPSGHVRLLPAPAGDVAALVAAQLKQTPPERRLLVYVGATWCEPCERFKHAAAAGQLDAEFGDVDLLVFDADADSERLATAGYVSQLIPLLVWPNADGRASERHIEGSVKGDGAIADMAPRLKGLLGR